MSTQLNRAIPGTKAAAQCRGVAGNLLATPSMIREDFEARSSLVATAPEEPNG
jgi:hypothetical protein